MGGHGDVLFPYVSARIISSIVHFVGSAIVAFCLARRTANEDIPFSFQKGWRTISYARLAIILVFCDSLLFLVFSGILIHGVGLERNYTTCSLGIFACIFLYTTTKILIYSFLSERVWLVWSNDSPTVNPRRLSSIVYRICATSIALYIICISLLVVFRIARLDPNSGVCRIGLQKPASILVLMFDVYITILMTFLFIYPMWRDKVKNPRLRRMAFRTLIASLVALTTSAINVIVLASLHGYELGWLCLASCGTDVTVNAFVLYFVTERRSKFSPNPRASKRSNANMAIVDGLEVLGITKDLDTGTNSSDGGRRDSARSRRSSAFSSSLRTITEGMRSKRRRRFWQRRHEVRFPPPSPSRVSVAAIPSQPPFRGIVEYGGKGQACGISAFQPPYSGGALAPSPNSTIVFATRPKLSDDNTEDSSCRTRLSFSGDSLVHQNTSESSSHSNHKPRTIPVTAQRNDSNPRGERLLSLEDMLRKGAADSLEAPESYSNPSSSLPPSPLRSDLQNSVEDPHVFKMGRYSGTGPHHTSCPPKMSLPSSSPPPPTTFTPIEIPPSRRNVPFLPHQVPKPTPESSALFGNWQGFQPTATGVSRPSMLPSAKGPKDDSLPAALADASRRKHAEPDVEIDLSELGQSIRDV